MTTITESSTAIELNPSTTPQFSIIWLHGLGADGNDFVPLVSELNLPKEVPIRWIFPHAPIMPVTVNNGYQMRAWFDIYGITIDNKIDETGIHKSLQQTIELIEKEEQRGILSKNIILAGFSQGAVIAMNTGLRYTKPLAGVIALSGYLPLADKVVAEASKVNQTLPIFVAHGTEDTIVPLNLGQSTRMALEHAGYSVTWRSYAMAHSVCIEEIHDIRKWLLARMI